MEKRKIGVDRRQDRNRKKKMSGGKMEKEGRRHERCRIHERK